MPTPRGALACVVIGNLIYAVGGASPRGDSNVNEAYDPESDIWRLDLAPLPTESQHLAAAELGGLLHVFGGRSARQGMTGTIHDVYDPLANVWTSAAPVPTGRSGIGALGNQRPTQPIMQQIRDHK